MRAHTSRAQSVKYTYGRGPGPAYSLISTSQTCSHGMGVPKDRYITSF